MVSDGVLYKVANGIADTIVTPFVAAVSKNRSLIAAKHVGHAEAKHQMTSNDLPSLVDVVTSSDSNNINSSECMSTRMIKGTDDFQISCSTCSRDREFLSSFLLFLRYAKMHF